MEFKINDNKEKIEIEFRLFKNDDEKSVSLYANNYLIAWVNVDGTVDIARHNLKKLGLKLNEE